MVSADAEKIFVAFEMSALTAIAFGIFFSFKINASILHLSDYPLSVGGVLRFGGQIGVDNVRLAVGAVYFLIVSVSQLEDLSFYINDLIELAFFVLFVRRKSVLDE